MNKEKILEAVNKKCRQHDVRLVYLCLFGSHLYGTNTETSDLDIKGVFLPSKESLLLTKPTMPIAWSTGDDRSKNTKEDVDVELFSLQAWLGNLKKGDTHALDLLFSFTNHDCIIYGDWPLNSIFDNTLKYLDLDAVYTRVYEYAFSQARKYGIKGSRMGVLKRIDNWTETKRDFFNNETGPRLREYIDSILEKFGDESYCFAKEINGLRSLVICGRVHQGAIKMLEFAQRIHNQYETYGVRAKLAEENQGIDWKACSHALRAVYQIQELLTDGKITFPLAQSEKVLKVKRGEVPWNEVEKLVLQELEALAALKNENKFGDKYQPDLADKIILSCY